MSQNKIYVGNIAFTVSEDDLKLAFTKYGPIEDMKLVIDRATGRSRGFCFITFQKQFDAEASLQLNDADISLACLSTGGFVVLLVLPIMGALA